MTEHHGLYIRGIDETDPVYFSAANSAHCATLQNMLEFVGGDDEPPHLSSPVKAVGLRLMVELLDDGLGWRWLSALSAADFFALADAANYLDVHDPEGAAVSEAANESEEPVPPPLLRRMSNGRPDDSEHTPCELGRKRSRTASISDHDHLHLLQQQAFSLQRYLSLRAAVLCCDQCTDVRRQALELMDRLPAQVVPPHALAIVGCLADKHMAVRCAALQLLPILAAKPEGLSSLYKRVGPDHSSLLGHALSGQRASSSALMRLLDDAAADPRRKQLRTLAVDLLARRGDAVLKPAVKHGDGEVRQAGVMAMGEMLLVGSEGRAALPAVSAAARPARLRLLARRMRHDRDCLVRQEAAMQLGRLPSTDVQAVVAQLVASLEDRDGGVSTAAITALSRLEPPALRTHALPAIVAKLDHDEPRVRRTAITALRRLVREPPAADGWAALRQGVEGCLSPRCLPRVLEVDREFPPLR